VIVASESYKFSEKVQLDSIVHNELGQTSEIAIMIRADGVAAAGGGGATAAGSSSSAAAAAAIGTSGSKQLLVPAAQMQYGYRGCADSNNSKTIMSQMIDEPPIVIPTQWHNSNNSSYNNNNNQSSQHLPFNVLNLRYDLTPISNISVVATETGLIPPTSIPVLIREIQSDTYQSTSSSSY
jgi:translation initiation factor 2B subunit (eIF-2B alpha/beta/delta family)